MSRPLTHRQANSTMDANVQTIGYTVQAAEELSVTDARFRLPVTLEPWLAAGKFASAHTMPWPPHSPRLIPGSLPGASSCASIGQRVSYSLRSRRAILVLILIRCVMSLSARRSGRILMSQRGKHYDYTYILILRSLFTHSYYLHAYVR